MSSDKHILDHLEALAQSLEERSVLLETVSEAVVYFDQNLEVLWANQHAEKLFGCRIADFLGRTCWELLHQGDKPCKNCPISLSWQTGQPGKCEIKAPSGKTWLFRTSPIKGEDDIIRGVIGVGLDISTLREIEQATYHLHALSIQLGSTSSLQDASRCVLDCCLNIGEIDCGGVYLLDPMGNLAMTCHQGISTEFVDQVLLFTPDSTMYHELAQQNQQVCSSDDFKGVSPDLLRQEGILCLAAYPIFQNDQLIGSLHVASHHARVFSPLTVNLLETLASQIANTLGRIVSDQQNQRLSNALEKSSDACLTIDRYGVITYHNKAFENITGYAKTQIQGHNLSFMMSPAEGRMIHDQVIDYLLQMKTWSGLLPIRTADGKEIRLQATFTPIAQQHSEHEDICLVVMRDNRAEQELQKQLRQSQKMQAIGTLAGGIAHDFNNILYAILGYTDLAMREVSEDSRIAQRLSEVMKAGDRAVELVRQILSFSRQTEQSRQPLSLGPVLKEVSKLLHSSFPSTITITTEIDGQCPNVLADPVQIQQMLTNICTNAYEAMRQTGGTLVIQLKQCLTRPQGTLAQQDSEETLFAQITIRDNGPGIPPDHLDRIFDPYFTTKQDGDGNGLGLAVVHGIVANHDGWIEHHSKVGEGATFRIYIPVLQNREVPQVEADSGEMIPARGILIDDEQPVLKMGRLLLEEYGYQVDIYDNAHEALEAVKSHINQIDFVITDLTMPYMTGLDLAREIQLLRPDLPIIMCTGYSEVVDAQTAYAHGIQAYLNKPISGAVLHRTIQKCLANSLPEGDL